MTTPNSVQNTEPSKMGQIINTRFNVHNYFLKYKDRELLVKYNTLWNFNSAKLHRRITSQWTKRGSEGLRKETEPTHFESDKRQSQLVLRMCLSNEKRKAF